MVKWSNSIPVISVIVPAISGIFPGISVIVFFTKKRENHQNSQSTAAFDNRMQLFPGQHVIYRDYCPRSRSNSAKLEGINVFHSCGILINTLLLK